MAAGGTVKLLNSRIDSYSSTVAGVDLGWIWLTGYEDVSLGITLSNLGIVLDSYTEINESLPAILRIGGAKILEHLPLTLNLTANLEGNNGTGSLFRLSSMDQVYLVFAGEFIISPMLLARAGYSSRGSDYSVEGERDITAGLTAGFAILLNQLNLEYSFQSYGAIGMTHKLGVTFQLPSFGSLDHNR